MTYPIILKQINKSNWMASMANNNWAYAYGDTVEEAKLNLEDVIAKSIEVIIENNMKLDLKTSSFSEVLTIIKSYKENVVISDISIDIEKIKNYKKKIRTNIMVRQGYKELAKKRGINLSETLDKALSQKLNLEF